MKMLFQTLLHHVYNRIASLRLDGIAVTCCNYHENPLSMEEGGSFVLHFLRNNLMRPSNTNEYHGYDNQSATHDVHDEHCHHDQQNGYHNGQVSRDVGDKPILCELLRHVEVPVGTTDQ